jgi:hypothetical protein
MTRNDLTSVLIYVLIAETQTYRVFQLESPSQSKEGQSEQSGVGAPASMEQYPNRSRAIEPDPREQSTIQTDLHDLRRPQVSSILRIT